MALCAFPTGVAATHAELPVLGLLYHEILVRLTNSMQMPPMPLSACWGAFLHIIRLARCGPPLETESGL